MPKPMFGMTLQDWKGKFVDTKKLLDVMDRMEHGFLMRMGAFVRAAAKRSIRRPRQQALSSMSTDERRIQHIIARKAEARGRRKPRRPGLPSEPGEPPRSQSGDLKGEIYFAVEADGRMVAGPAKLSGETMYGVRTVPEVLEEGGTVAAGGKSFTIEPRPYMLPALHAAEEKQDDFWIQAFTQAGR